VVGVVVVVATVVVGAVGPMLDAVAPLQAITAAARAATPAAPSSGCVIDVLLQYSTVRPLRNGAVEPPVL
jgi:hypothetical protein